MASEDLAEDDPARRGRLANDRRAWGDAYEALSLADGAAGLAADALERLAFAAYLTGRDDALAALDRAHQAHVDGDEVARAVRCAGWLRMLLMQGGRPAQGSIRLTRARALLPGADGGEVEQGYFLFPMTLRHSTRAIPPRRWPPSSR